MSKRIKQIAKRLGGKVVARLPETGGGAFGAARLVALRERLRPQTGVRTGRPSDAQWSIRRNIPMSPETYAKLQAMAAQASDDQRKVSPMQIAAQLLEHSLQEQR